MRKVLVLTLVMALALGVAVTAQKEDAAKKKRMPLIFSDDFEKGMDAWKTTDVKEKFWEVVDSDQGNKALRVKGKSTYQPPVRSPHSIALVKDVIVGDFVLTAKIQNTNYDAGAHRDLCFFWGYQDPSHFYYAHLGAKADPHACQIFIVDGEPRIKITSEGKTVTPWTRGWHNVKVVRNVEEGTMKVFFDDMKTPHFVANDKTFIWGQVGVGTFDDNGNFDDIKLRGIKVERPKKAAEKK